MKQLEIEVRAGTSRIDKLSPVAAKELQQFLKEYGSYTGQIDGAIGPKTQAGFAQWKRDEWLQYPDRIGMGTLSKIRAYLEKHSVSEQEIDISKISINQDAGQKTGRSMRLPTGDVVYANQWIALGIPLTWGEMTKNCSRHLTNKSDVKSIHIVAKQFGIVRDLYDAPLVVTSGYRPPSLNIGASKSQHKKGRAIDICPLDRNLNKLWAIALASNAIGLGDGRYKGFVHFDWRSNKRRVIWTY